MAWQLKKTIRCDAADITVDGNGECTWTSFIAQAQAAGLNLDGTEGTQCTGTKTCSCPSGVRITGIGNSCTCEVSGGVLHINCPGNCADGEINCHNT